MYNTDKKISRKEPWHTAQFISASLKSQPFIETNCLWLER